MFKGARYMASGKHTAMNEHLIQEGVVKLQVVRRVEWADGSSEPLGQSAVSPVRFTFVNSIWTECNFTYWILSLAEISSIHYKML